MERIPIISLSGCKSLTDFITELPIPQPAHVIVGCRTLLYEPKLVHDAYRCINSEDPALIQQLCTALTGVSVDNIIFKDVTVDSSQEAPKTTPLPGLLTILENSGAFLPHSKLKGTKNHTKEVSLQQLSSITEDSALLSDPILHLDTQQPEKNGDSPSESYSAIHIAPLKLSLKKCLHTGDGPTKKRNKSRRKPESSPKLKVVPLNRTAELRNQHTVGKDVAQSEPSQAQIPVLKISTASVPETAFACTVHEETSRNTPSSESLPQSIQAPQSTGSPQPLSISIPLLSAAVGEEPVVPTSSECLVSDFVESVPEPSTSSSPRHTIHSPNATSSMVPTTTVVIPMSTITDSGATPTAAVAVSSTAISVTTPNVGASPVSSASHPVNHDNASSRRVPDPALSQMFHSAALFHTYQAHGEPEKSGSCAGGGLFDDWLDASVKTSEPSLLGPINDCIYSGSLSGPSSVVNVPSNCSQAPHSVGASADVSVCAPRTPLSVPSNHSSYPTTPGGGLTTVALSVNTAVNTIAVSPSTLSKCIYPSTGINSPSARLFDTSEVRAESHEPTVEEQTRIAPQGLAAYLPRSGSLRPAVNDDGSAAIFVEEGRASSPGTAISPDGTGVRSCGVFESGSKPSSTNKQSKSTCGNTSPAKSNGRGRSSTGKPRGGGRRRRTELEELTSWSVNDRAQALADKKSENASDLLDAQSIEPKEAISVNALETMPNDPPKTAEQVTHNTDISTGSSHGAFTEALVERVKRRRQQREMELNRCRSGQFDRHACRSSDISPASTPSPTRSTGHGGELALKASKTNELKNQHRMDSRFTVDRRMTNRGTDTSRSLPNPTERSRIKQLRHKSSDSDTSLSPPSTTASSIRSSKPSSVSSCIDSVPSVAEHIDTHSTYPVATKTTVPSHNLLNPTRDSPERFPDSVISKPNETSRSSNSLPAKNVHDCLSSESHFSPPIRTLFKENLSKTPSPTHSRNQGPLKAFIHHNNRYADRWHESRHLSSPVHSPLANKTYASQEKRRRRVIISDDEEMKAPSLQMDSPTMRTRSHPPPRLDEFDPQDFRTEPGSQRPSRCSVSSLPPTLQPLKGVSNVAATSTKHVTSAVSMEISGTTIPLTHSSRDNKELIRVPTSSMISANEKSLDAARSRTDLLNDSKMPILNGFERTYVNTTELDHETTTDKHGMHVPRALNTNPETDGHMSSDDDGYTRAIRASQRSPSNESVSGLASSTQLAFTSSGSLLPEPGCRTPSTIAYTHSSAMGDSDSRDSDWELSPDTSGQRPEADSGIATPNASPASAQDVEESDFSDESLTPTKVSDYSSPSSLSAQSDSDQRGSADDSDESRHHSEELTEAAAALAQFTERLSKILRRVEELDLLRLATKVNEHRRAQGDHSTHSGTDGEPDTSSFDEHLIPDAARLTRHELSVLYSESAQVRLSGSMFTIPTGRLVRFLTLLLVNMQAGAHTTPVPLTQAEVDHFLRKRQKAELQYRDGSRRSQSNQLTESILWANPLWASVLVALDCARIALNIIVAPDMPRPLLMEDLIDGIVSVVRCQLEGVVCKTYNNSRSTNHQLGFSDKQLWNFACECVGFRTSQLMAVLSSLIRFQPNRFTDNLVIRLTELGLIVPLYCLTSGQSIERDPKRLAVPAMRKLLSHASSSHSDHRNNVSFSFSVGPSRLCLLVWPDRLQRASLALLAGLYGQYEAHRKLIVDEIFRTLLSQSVTSSSVNTAASSEELPLSVSSSSDKRATRTFRLLSSYWLYKQNQQQKHAQRTSPPTTDAGDPTDSVHVTEENRNSQFVYVHALTALFLSLSQGLIQSPGCGTGASTSSGPSGASRKSVSTPGSGEQSVLDNTQFLKDEKLVLASYNICVRHAHYLLSGLLKRVCTRTELDLRPVLDAVTCDLLNVATAAPVEWPVASTLLCVLGSLLIQHLSQNSASSTNTSRTTDLSSKLIYLDTMSTLALGLKRSAVLSLEHRSSLRRPELAARDSQNPLPSSRSGSNEAEEFVASEANLRRRELLARTQLIGFISSPVPMLNNWLLQPGLRDGEETPGPGRHQERDCMKQIRLEYADYLFVTAQRFFLAAWLHSCTRDLGEAITHASNRRSGVETSSASSSKSASKRVRELEQLRHQLLSELTLTHHLPSSLPWLTGSKHSGSALVGSSSLSSPSSNKPVRQNSASHTRASSGSTPSRMLIYGGSFLSHDSTAKRFMEYAHSRHMDAKLRLRLAAHAHWSAWQLMSLHPIAPGFDKLFSSICRLVGESSVPVRTKALRCLAAVIEIDPKLFVCNSTPKDSDKQLGQTAWLRDLPRLVHARLLDNSAAVREAAVDLVSKVLVLRPRALCEYYPMLAERVLDKGVSVRKRAIRCFRDLLVVDWDGSGNGSLSATSGRAIRPRGKHKFILMTNQLGVEMCLKLIRRLHDEDSIQKLVIEVFHSLWFTPIPEMNVHCSRLLDRRILSLSAVTLTLRASNFEVLESSLKQILTTNDSAKFEQLDAACVQLVSRLLVLIKRLSAAFLSGQRRHAERPKPVRASDSSLPMPSLQGLLASLHLLSRCKPELLRVHAEYLINLLRRAPLAPLTPTPTVVASSTNSPALSQTSSDTLLGLDAQCLYHLISIIEMTLFSIASNSTEAVPDHISINKLNDLQVDLVRLIQRQGRLVVDSALSCLATLTNRVLKDHTRVVVCFAQFYGLLANLSSDLRRSMMPTRVANPPTHISSRTRPSVLRALYTVGLMCKHFALDDLLSEDKRMSTNTKSFLNEVVDTLILYAEYASAQVPGATSDSKQMNDADLCRKAIMGLGFLVCRHDHLLCDKRVSTFFSHFFINTTVTPCSSPAISSGGSGLAKPSPFQEVQCIILDNLTHYLMDSERQMVADSRSWSMHHKQESLKELTDQRSGHGSAVSQEYLPLVLKHCILTQSLNVRTSALGLLSVILRQGLVHPVQTLASLICLQTDPDTSNRSRATHLLVEAERKVPGFIAMRAASGIQLSYQLHLLLYSSTTSGLNRDPTTSVIPLVRGASQESVNSATSDPATSVSMTGTCPIALNHAVYSLLRSNRQNRRSLISSLLALFDLDQTKRFDLEDPTLAQTIRKPCLGQLIFVADQLAHFPYAVLDEVLFIAYHVEQRLSVNCSSLVQLIQQALLSSLVKSDSDAHQSKKDRSSGASSQAETYLLNLIESVESKVLASGNQRKIEKLAGHPGTDWDQDGKLHQLFTQAQPTQLRDKARQAMVSNGPICWLLISLRHHLRDYFGVTDSKLKDYSPSDSPKQWERPIVLPKRAPNNNSSGHILRLPTLVIQCLNNPSWSQLDPGPPDTVILYQFIRLRHQLLALEDSSHVTGFLSPNPVTHLPTMIATAPDGSAENCTPVVGPGGDSQLSNTHSSNEFSMGAEESSKKRRVNAALESRSDQPEPSGESETCKASDQTWSKIERGQIGSNTVQSASRSSSGTTYFPPASTTRPRHIEKSQTRKRHPRSSSTSLSSSSSSSDLSVDSKRVSRQRDRVSNGASQAKTPHTPAKLARVGQKSTHSSSSKPPAREISPVNSCQQPPPLHSSRSHKGSKRPLASEGVHSQMSRKDAPKRRPQHSSSSSDLESSSSADESGSNTEIESTRGRHAFAKHARKHSGEQESPLDHSQKRSGKPPGQPAHHAGQLNARSSRMDLSDRRIKNAATSKRENTAKSDSQTVKTRPDRKIDSSSSLTKTPIQPCTATTKSTEKTVAMKASRPSATASTRSLAPLPQAMMQGVHGQSHRSITQGHGKHNRKHTAPPVSGSNSTKQQFESRTANERLPPPASDRPGKPAQSKSNSSASAPGDAQSHDKTASGRNQHERVVKAVPKPKPSRTIRRLSDSSSLSSDSGVIGKVSTAVYDPSKNQCNSNHNSNTTSNLSENKSIKHHTTGSVVASSRGPAHRSVRQRSSSSVSSVSSASSSSDVSSSSSSTTSMSSSSSTASLSSSPMSDSSNPTPATKSNKQRKLVVR